MWQERVPRERRQRQSVLQKKPKAEDLRTECATCKGTGDNENLVRYVGYLSLTLRELKFHVHHFLIMEGKKHSIRAVVKILISKHSTL